MRMRSGGGVAVVAGLLALVSAGCGGSGSGAAGDAGATGAAPGIDPATRAAAEAAGCEITAYPAEYGALAATPTTPAPVPSVQGEHISQWADWGVYDVPVPEPYVIHNMSHGGVIVRLGAGVATDVRTAVVDLWSESPSLVLVEPGSEGVPAGGAVVTSWLRSMRCPAFTTSSVAALRAFRDAFRGHGIHITNGDYPGPEPRPADLPEPARAEADA